MGERGYVGVAFGGDICGGTTDVVVEKGQEQDAVVGMRNFLGSRCLQTPHVGQCGHLAVQRQGLQPGP